MRIQDHFSISVKLMLATASAQVCVPLGHSSLYFHSAVITTVLYFDMARIVSVYMPTLLSFLLEARCLETASAMPKNRLSSVRYKFYRCVFHIFALVQKSGIVE